jgi:predicted transcriptional regulator of viral defense system
MHLKMNFLEFTKVFGNNQVIDIRNVLTYFNGLDRRRLFEWQKKGYLVKVVSNFYIFPDNPIDDLLLKEIACLVYPPAYIALESALAYYNFIPEAVFQTVGITTRRNKTIRATVGDFRFRSIKPSLFFGYNSLESASRRFTISDPEKTLLDYFYFYPKAAEKDALVEMRLNLDEVRRLVDGKKLHNYLQLFSSPKLNKTVKLLMEMAHVEF